MIYLDNGHGGMIAGKYVTAPDKMYCFGEECIYEGEFNRQVVYRVMESLDLMGIPYVNVCPEIRDVSLQTRTDRANKDWIERGMPKSIFLSIHANAGGGRGAEAFTYPGDSPADRYADILLNNMNLIGRIRTDESDGDLDKEAKFHVLRETLMPAVLLECAFMDNKSDFDKLISRDFRQKCADMVSLSLHEINEKYLKL